MSIRFDQPSSGLPTSGSGPDLGAEIARQGSGGLRGTQAAGTAQTVLGDAAEEISLHLSEKVESKTHQQRTVRQGTQLPRMRIDQINAYLDKARRQDAAEEIAQFARRMLGSNGQDLHGLMRQSRLLRQPTEQFLLLQYARQLAQSQQASPQLREAIDEALADLEAWHGDSIRVDQLTIDPASRYGETAGEVSQFQGAVHTILGKPTLTQALQEVLDLAGRTGGKLEGALDNLMGALGACLAAARSGSEKALLETLLTDLYHLKSIRTVLESCRALVRTLKRREQRGREERRRREAPAGDSDGDGDAAPPVAPPR